MTKIQSILVVSDLHVGDPGALWPSQREDGRAPADRHIRDWIRQQWAEFTGPWLNAVNGDSPFALVVNGDIIQGNHRIFGDLMAKSLSKQLRAAREVLSPLIERAAKVIVIEGTEIHTGDEEDEFGEAVEDFAPGKLVRTVSGRWCHQRARITLNGLTHGFRHHTTVAGRAWTEAGNQANHLSDDILRQLRKGHEPTDVLVLAHRHTQGTTHTADGTSIVTLSWQGSSRYVRAKTREDGVTVGGAYIDYRNRLYQESPDVRHFARSIAEPESLDLSLGDVAAAERPASV